MERNPPSAPVLWSRLLLLLAAIASPACSRPAPASKAQPPSHTEPSEAEGLAYAKSLVAAFDARDRDALDALVDWRSIAEAATTGWELAAKERSNMYARMQGYMSGDQGLAARFIDNADEGGALHYLGNRRREGRQVLVFRMLTPTGNGDVSYFAFFARRFPDGEVRAADIYFYADGEFLAANIRRLILPVIAERSRNVFDKLITGEQDYVKDFPRLGEAARLMSESKAAEALVIFKALRPATRQNKSILRLRLQAAQEAGDEEFLAVFDEFQKLFPDDPCVELFSLNVLLLRKDYPAALKAVDRLDGSVGGDPYLDVIRGNIHTLQGDHKASAESARRAIEREPTLLEAHLALLAAELAQQKYDEALTAMKVVERDFGVAFDDIEQDEEYAGFVKSPKYSEWLAYLKTRPKPALNQPTAPDAGLPKPE